MNEQEAFSFRRLVRVTLFLTVGVIVYGAWVRITGSGAGCGEHWPTCGGEIVPRAPAAETVIEFTHRVTSGLAFLFVVGMVGFAFRTFKKGHPARMWSVASLVFMITEALIGAGLVIFGLVENDDSAVRALAMSVHLVNTFILTACLALSLFFGRVDAVRRGINRNAAEWKILAFAGALLLIVSMTGAVTALGDTLYPVQTDGSRLISAAALDGHPTAHFLVRVRAVHPVFAIIAAVFVAAVAISTGARREFATTRQLAWLVATLVLSQLLVGALNIALRAPGWLQLVHLGLATLVWIAFVLLTAHVTETGRPPADRRFFAGRSR